MNLPDEVELHGHYLEWLCLKGWDERGIPARAEKLAQVNGVEPEAQVRVYIDRLMHELEAIKRQRFVDYTLIVYDMINWARRNDIMVGPGRGSGAGSLVNFLIGITAIDPIEHKLLFERYLSPDRTDNPDLDVDYEDTRRDEVVQYLHDKYGDENVAQIATVSTLKGKSCLKDIARVYEVPYDEVNTVTSAIITRAAGDERVDHTIEDSFKESPACQEFAERWPEVYQQSVRAEGLHRQMGMHAAGVVTSPVPIVDLVPLEVKRDDDGNMTKFISVDKDAVEQLGLLKLDILGLKTLSQVKSATRAIKERHGVDLDMEKLALDDPQVLRRFSEQEFCGVFQFDSTSVEKICDGVTFTHFDDLVAVNALNRPGTTRTGATITWAKRKMGQEEVKPIHPVVDAIVRDTQGVILYQEQVAKIFIEVGGYTPGEADKIRKLMSKSKGVEIIEKEWDKFHTNATARGFSDQVARSLFNSSKSHGSYSFNRSHAAAYSAIAYWQMWLKHYYTTEFMWALLRNEDDAVILTKYVKEARRLGIEVRSPDVNLSSDDWKIVGPRVITASIGDVKGVGENAAREVIAHQPYASLSDFFAKVNRRVVNRRVITNLVLADAMTGVVANKKAFVDHAEAVCGEKDPLAKYLTYVGEPDYTEDEATIERQRVCPLAMDVHPLKAYEATIKTMGPHVHMESFEGVNWNGRVGCFCGMLTNYKVSRINSQTDKSYAHLTLEDEQERQLRVKVDVDQYEQHRHLLDRGEGTCLAMVAIKWKNETARLCYAVDLEDLRVARRDKQLLTGAASWFETSPLLRHGSPMADIAAVVAKKLSKRGSKVALVGMIVAVKEHEDKKGRTMAFFDLAGYEGSISAICFASSYDAYAEVLKPGVICEIELKRSDSKTFVLDAEAGCRLKVLERT